MNVFKVSKKSLVGIILIVAGVARHGGILERVDSCAMTNNGLLGSRKSFSLSYPPGALILIILAPINPGNSGGPLLDTRGKLIGMNTAILSDTNAFSGIGFAIPSNTITKIVPILIEKGYYPHGTYGAMMGAGSAGLSGAKVGGVDPHLFCNTAIMTPICK